jgi:hypothetical protein
MFAATWLLFGLTFGQVDFCKTVTFTGFAVAFTCVFVFINVSSAVFGAGALSSVVSVGFLATSLRRVELVSLMTFDSVSIETICVASFAFSLLAWVSVEAVGRAAFAPTLPSYMVSAATFTSAFACAILVGMLASARASFRLVAFLRALNLRQTFMGTSTFLGVFHTVGIALLACVELVSGMSFALAHRAEEV